ncbi:phosphoacetylglucosamine mutase [Nematocida sp. AWRm78]|nr:phosphoacetylglucosamine mutase [Nematocida sp. AWRm79]KAI5186065.1 phosphoacetylglucosamine mutase [Nematocida sp. AWRm78]
MDLNRIFKKTKPEPVSYGTAGYRTDSSIIKDIVCRTYLFCLIRSAQTGKPIGLVLTASHNPSSDNGIKYVDYNGNMVNSECEELSNKIVNGTDAIITEELSKIKGAKSTVVIAQDTRESGREMIDLCLKASDALGSTHILKDMGILTTPQMHFLIRELFAREITNEVVTDSEVLSKQLSEILDVYYKRMENFTHIIKRVFGEKEKEKIVLDSANGVGKTIYPKLKDTVSLVCDLSILTNTKDLNEECGSDYIKSTGNVPAGVDISRSQNRIDIQTDGGKVSEDLRICSFDGDADRIIYLKPLNSQLIDGDRLSVLFSSFLNHLISVANLNEKITTVITEYTNGAAARELKAKGEVKVAGTGVKNMQKETGKGITVWFESNGHGTISFSDDIIGAIKSMLGYESQDIGLLDLSGTDLSDTVDELLRKPMKNLALKEMRSTSPYNELFMRLSPQEALLLLYAMSALFDPFIGDAVVNMLLSECIFYSNFILPSVLLEVYQNMPNILTCVPGNRDRLNELVIESIKNKYHPIRVHLRPSGTEDVIRIYVEGEDMNQLKEVIEEIKTVLGEL